ncbi:unnamed protein product [Malus baccata var. baccata]
MSPSASLNDLLDEIESKLTIPPTPLPPNCRTQTPQMVAVGLGLKGAKESFDHSVKLSPKRVRAGQGLKESDVDSFVDDVLVNRKPWASGVQEPLTAFHVFVCAHCSGEEWNRDSARVLIDKFEEEAELRGLTNQVFVAACYHTGGHNGNLIIYNPCSNGSITGHWYGYVTPDDVPELLDWYQHIGKGDVIDRLWRGQIGASSDEAENINDQKLPNGGEIHETLKLSYDGLPDDHVKGVFLDISCFYIGWSLKIVEAILGGCNHFSVKAEINTLCDRGLLYIDEAKRLRMHDLIRDMGREIVRAESPVELGKRSRLWHSEDAKRVLRNECGTEAVEGLFLFLPEHFDDEQSFSTEAFKKMWRLKFLQLENVTLTGSYKHLSKELRALTWFGFPLEAIPADFDQRSLVFMELSNSKIVRVWEDSDLLPKKLKHLILKDCHNLTELPDFSKLPHLEILNLSGCKGLCGGYHFLAQLKMIETLVLRDCNITDGAVLEIIGSLSSLTFLDLGGNGFSRLPILSGLSQLQVLKLNHCTNLQAIPDLPNSLLELIAKHCTALEIMPDFSEMSKMTHLVLDDCHKLKDIPNFKNSLDYMDSIISIHMEGCTSLTDTFKENLQTKNAFGGITLFGNYIPNWLAYVAREDEIVQFKVPPSIDYIGGLALGIVYSSDNSDSTGYLHIDVVNRTQRTCFCIRIWKEATVTASHEYYLWLGNLSNRKLNLKGGDMVSVEAKFFGGDNRIKVNKTGVDIVKWHLSDGCTNWDYYVTMPYTFKEDIDNGTRLSICNVFLCYKTPEAWPWRIEGSESDPLPKFFASALKARKNDITATMLLTVIEGREGTEFSDGDVLIFPQMIKYRGLKESDVDSFVDDVLVNEEPWASGVEVPLTGSHVFVCVDGSRGECNRDSARVLIDKFKEEAELRGLTNQVFVTACYHTGGHNGNLIIYNPCSNGSITGHWYGYVTPHDVPELLDWYQHIGKGDVIDRLWRGQIGASSDEAENINDQKLPNGGEIHETLKLSYDGLPDDHVKGVFIDISCFYIGWSLNIVEAILGGCNHFSVKVEINTLCDRGLLYIDEDKRLRMHALIRDMGREIVRAESPVELGKRSRLWHSEDAKRVLRNECGTEAVEGLFLFLPEHFDDEQSFSTEAFKKMWRLKFLQLENVTLTGSYKHLSKELRALTWFGFPLEAIPADFDQRSLVFMELSNSKIVRVWEDSDLLPKKLKHLILKDCHNLTELPDFSKLPHLEILNLSGCKGLCGGYHFLAQLKMIETLVLRDCNITDGAVLEIIGSLSSLTFLDLGGNGFSRLPILSGLSQLQVLKLNHCTNLQAIPDLPNSLLELIAKHCTALEIMPDFSEMSKMTHLVLDDCHKLKDIPNFKNSLDYMDSIISIHMEGCTSLTDTFKENLQTVWYTHSLSLSLSLSAFCIVAYTNFAPPWFRKMHLVELLSLEIIFLTG